MTKENRKAGRVLALFPARQGFGYAVFEGPRSPVDWGAKQVAGNKNTQSLQRIAELVKRFRPGIVVLEAATRGRGTRKSGRVHRLLEAIKRLLKKKGIRLVSYSRTQIRAAFAQYAAVTKHDIATVIARMLPEFAVRLPPKRRIWEPEPYAMMIFDAVSLVFTFYHLAEA